MTIFRELPSTPVALGRSSSVCGEDTPRDDFTFDTPVGMFETLWPNVSHGFKFLVEVSALILHNFIHSATLVGSLFETSLTTGPGLKFLFVARGSKG